jgi:hypothetical protein
VLGHKSAALLTKELLWKARVIQQRDGASGIQAKDHFDALQLVKPGLPGLQLLDGDAHVGLQSMPITGIGLQRLRWRRYEIESYLVHPAALETFVRKQLGDDSDQAIADMQAYMISVFQQEFLDNPMQPVPLVENYLVNTKARSDVIPAILQSAGLHNVLYTRFHEIAALMTPEQIHPEVKEKLDGICRAFGVEP